MMARRALIARGAFAGAASPDPSTGRLDPGADVSRRRAARQEDGEPIGASKSAKTPLMSTRQIWQGGICSRHGHVIWSSCHSFRRRD